MMRAIIVAAGTAAALLSGTAQAEIYGDCLRTERDVKTYVRVVQSCSDAAFARMDVNEADALCAAARILSDRHEDVLSRQIEAAKGPTTPENQCARERVLPQMGAYMKALGWSIDFARARIDSTGKDTLKPLSIGQVD